MSRHDARFEERLGDGAPAIVSLFDVLPIAISVMWPIRDAAGDVHDFSLGYANAAAGRILGVALDGGMGERMREAMPGLIDSGQFARFARVADTGEPDSAEIVMDAVWRGTVTVRGVWSSSAVRFAESVLSVNIDITEERRRQQELRDFAAVAAHDLREPLVGIRVMAGALANAQDLSARTQSMATMLGEGAGHAQRLVDGILDYAGAEHESAGREEVDAGSVVAEVCRSLAEQVRAAGADVEVGALPTVRASRNGMTRVFQNLMANALKFRAEARPLRIVVGAGADSGGWTFWVADNGRGLPEGRSIFEMFERGSHEVPGSGIGLATCRRVVEAHGGRIWAEPGDEAGTTFRFTIPAAA